MSMGHESANPIALFVGSVLSWMSLITWVRCSAAHDVEPQQPGPEAWDDDISRFRAQAPKLEASYRCVAYRQTLALNCISDV